MGFERQASLHAMESRPVHASPRQFTSNPAEQAIRSDCIASVHQSSPRTVTSLVTSRPHTRACPHNPSLFPVHAPCLAGPLPQPVGRHPLRPVVRSILDRISEDAAEGAAILRTLIVRQRGMRVPADPGGTRRLPPDPVS